MLFLNPEMKMQIYRLLFWAQGLHQVITRDVSGAVVLVIRQPSKLSALEF